MRLKNSGSLLAIMLILSNCGLRDHRCELDKFYCLNDNDKKQYLVHASDEHLLKLSEIDEEFGRPPSFLFIYILRDRGEVRSRSAMYNYASDRPKKALMDQMVRAFSKDWSVCTVWLGASPATARKSLSQSCETVFHAG